MSLVYGLITGILFGILLQRAEVIRYDRQLGALRLLDMTILKYMLSAILVGMVLLAILLDAGQVSLSVKGLSFGAQGIGGLLFGIGWAVLGYCPGTSMGALGEGRFDAFWGILGGWAGAAVYAEVYPSLKTSVLKWGDAGKLTLDQWLGLNHWIVIVAVAAVFLALFALFERKNL